jgi:hypothetical protein
MYESTLSKNKYFFYIFFFIINSIFSQQFRDASNYADVNIYEDNNGIAIADYDQDGDLDIFIVGSFSEENNSQTWSRLLQNTNSGNFIDVTVNTGIEQNLNHDIILNDIGFLDLQQDFGDRLSASWGDFNNDSFPDLFLGNSNQSQLYQNNTDGSFTNITNQSGLAIDCDTCFVTSGLWLDYNIDGLLDLFITDYHSSSNNKLYKNLGSGMFENVDLGEMIDPMNSFSSIVIYANDDNYPDIYITNDHDQNNVLLINQQGQGFVNEAESYNLLDPYDGMGLATSDYDNNNNFEILVTNIKENSFYVDQFMDSQYVNYSENVNIYDTNWAWGAIFSDYNHDGFEDLFIANGFSVHEENEFFFNVSTGSQSVQSRKFSATNPLVNQVELTKSRSLASFDYDNDGDLDLLISNFDSSLILYENKAIDSYFTEINQGSWVKVSLKGTVSNNDALGSVVEIYPNNDIDQSRLYHGSSYQNQSIQSVHFGLENATSIDSLIVTWPNTGRQTYQDISINSSITIIENEGVTVSDNNTSVKIEGCTNISSCNYNPDATVDDGSCQFLTAGDLEGETNIEPLVPYYYSFESTDSTNYLWSVVNGTILSGQGTSSVYVIWDVTTEGNLSVSAFNDVCSTEIELLEMNIDLSEIDWDTNNISIARFWNEILLEAIRNDYARPTVHARNLFHVSAAMYDAWAIIKEQGSTYLIGQSVNDFNVDYGSFSNDLTEEENMITAISYCAYRLISHRFSQSPNSEYIINLANFYMSLFDYDIENYDTLNNTQDPVHLGNYIAENYILYGLEDGSMEELNYENQYYLPVNDPLLPLLSGNENIIDPNRWQPLTLNVFIDQSGQVTGENTPPFLGAEWGNVHPFGLNQDDLSIFSRDDNVYKVYQDPGAPPLLNNSDQESLDFINAFSMVSIWGSHLSSENNVSWDISPNSIGNFPLDNLPEEVSDYNNFYNYYLGGDTSNGHDLNPYTNLPYEPQYALRGDYARVLAEFWADGPESETPPGHWFVLLNKVNDDPLLVKKFQGTGELLSNLEWDIKSYFILGGTMHDAAVSVWGIKGWYDYVRPISIIRYLSGLGQSTNPSSDNYHPQGLPIVEGFIEAVEEGDFLQGDNNENIGKIKLFTWRGHDYIDDVDLDQASVGWILAEDWWPYQRPTFVTPNFAGYVSGHSTFSRAAAEVLTMFTGSSYFPAGIGRFFAPKDEFLVFEQGPSENVELQWATYRDAADQCSLSRIWGGIHPYIDDIPGRIIGNTIGNESFEFGASYFSNNLAIPSFEKNRLILKYNPINSNQNIEILNTSVIDNFELFNLIGQRINIEEIHNPSSNSTTLSHDYLNPGIYVLNNKNYSWKIIVR